MKGSKEVVKNILDIRPEELARQQELYLVQGMQGIIDAFSAHLRNREYAEAEKMLAYSPAGDEMGCEDNYLDFASLGAGLGDAGRCVDRLKALKQIQMGQEEQLRDFMRG